VCDSTGMCQRRCLTKIIVRVRHAVVLSLKLAIAQVDNWRRWASEQDRSTHELKVRCCHRSSARSKEQQAAENLGDVRSHVEALSLMLIHVGALAYT
jgi:hypothetical protein